MTVEASLLGLGDVLKERAQLRPDAPFITFAGKTWSFGRLDAEATSFAAALAGLGIEPGDRIAIDLPNWPEFVITLFAAAKLGATIVPLNPQHASRDVQFMLRNSEATVVVAAEDFGERDYLQLFETLLVGLPDLQYLVTVGEEDLWYDDRIFQFEDLVSSGRGREANFPDIDPSTVPAAILYTSGTTGKPKGVVLSHMNLACNARATAQALRLSPSDVTLCAVPLFNIFGLGAALLPALVSGSSVVLQESFEPAEAIKLIEAHGATIVHGVPTMFVLMLRDVALQERDVSSLRGGIVAGAPVPPELARRVRRELAPGVEIAYGTTETSAAVSMTSPEDPEEKRSETVGRALEGVSIRVLDDSGNPLAAGATGEVAVAGDNIMLRYFRQPGETAATITEDGFFKSGDLGVLDQEGYLQIVGISGDMILRGGYSIEPREVEDQLRSHPAVVDAVVFGIPNEVLGELTCACVQLVEGAIITEEELREFCRSDLAGYKVPDLVRFVEEFPRTPDGEVRRLELARTVRSDVSDVSDS